MPEVEQPWVKIVGSLIIGGASVLAAAIPLATKIIGDRTPVIADRPGVPAVSGFEAQRRAEQQSEAVLAKAERAATEGQPGQGLILLDGVSPAAPLADRFRQLRERLTAQLDAGQRLEAVRAAAERAGAEGHPQQGLALLAGASPAAPLADRFRQLQERLSAQLARLDAAPPSIELRQGFRLEYDREVPLEVPLLITDDLEVKTTECMARAESGAAFQPVPVRHLTGADYEVDIPPELHQNPTLELYATASDNSGHQSQLGSSEKPLLLNRRGWWRRHFLGKAGD